MDDNILVQLRYDIGTRKLFYICFFLYFFALFILGISACLKGSYIIIILCCPGAVLLSLLTVFISGMIGKKTGSIYWPSEKIPPREQLSADIARAKYSKGTGHFEEALSIINDVLEKDPDYPDALYLKAHILWEGFENSKGALESLIRIMELVKDNEPIYHWASNYYHEVKKGHIIEN